MGFTKSVKKGIQSCKEREREKWQNNLASSSKIPESGCVSFMMEGARGLREVIFVV